MSKFTIRLIKDPEKIRDEWAYEKIQHYDKQIFPGCSNPFRTGTHWWAVLDENGEVVGYCGIRWREEMDYVYLCRCGVRVTWRGNGLHKRMIDVRLRMANRLGASQVITDVVIDNIISANNLLKKGFKLYCPRVPWAGERGVLYFKKRLR